MFTQITEFFLLLCFLIWGFGKQIFLVKKKTVKAPNSPLSFYRPCRHYSVTHLLQWSSR